MNAIAPAPSESLITNDAIRAILGIRKEIPLTPEAMATSLRVTFFPGGKLTPRLEAFAEKLRGAMADCGVRIIPYEQALMQGKRGKVQEGIVIIAPGELESGNLPVDHLPNLRTNTVVGIVDGPCPAVGIGGQQEKLNSIVETLGWNIVQVVIYVEDPNWTICTMNGAIIPCTDPSAFRHDVFSTLVPKLAAPVVPPHASDFAMEKEPLDLYSSAYRTYVDDFERGAPLWDRTGLLLFHTSLDSLAFRNRYYKRVAAAYLDKRSGMSYGFLARQVATPTSAAQMLPEDGHPTALPDLTEHGFVRMRGAVHALLNVGDLRLLVEVPPVYVLATRSGCDKAHIDGHRDLMLLGLRDGVISLKTPSEAAHIDFRPSYDTLTILAHGVANALIAGVLARIRPDSRFLKILRQQGMALAHWHGDMDMARIPAGFSVFGTENPPVSCSTHQAAMFTLRGKLAAFARCVAEARPHLGDVHIEPHHGINVTWPTLTGLARHLLREDLSAELPEEYESPEPMIASRTAL